MRRRRSRSFSLRPIQRSGARQFGMVGPSALGEQAQNSIHKILGAPRALGWDSQLHDEFAFAASFDRRWRWVPFGVPGVAGLCRNGG
ncbi:MAG: DUF2219 family protein [Proteobacteria bacterium]|nr:DUF2219 family protein [Pseudomonadota bacterium]